MGSDQEEDVMMRYKDLQHHLYDNEIQTVIDIDLKNFFGTIDHEILEDILKEKIKDTKFMRYINRMFKAGVLSEWRPQNERGRGAAGEHLQPSACERIRSLCDRYMDRRNGQTELQRKSQTFPICG